MAEIENQPKTAATANRQNVAGREYGKERFEFLLTVNDNIICQRNFHIHSLNPRSLSSKELYYSAMKCVGMIKDDLRWKTQVYLEAIAPQVFPTEEAMRAYLAHPTFRLTAPCFVHIKDTGKNFVLCEDTFTKMPNGETLAYVNAKVRPYDGPRNEAGVSKGINFFDTVKRDSDECDSCVLKFIIRDNGRELINISWDGLVYPRFVRTNIDLSNSRNRYITDDDKRITLESMLVDAMKNGRRDLISPMLREICQCCSCWSDDNNVVKYTDKETYGEETYFFNIEETNNRRDRMAEKFRLKALGIISDEKGSYRKKNRNENGK